MSQGFSINKNLSRIAARKGGLAGTGSTFTRRTTVWHRINVPRAGSQAFTFFNVARSPGVTNLDQAGTLSANQLAEVKSIRFSFLAGFDVLGRRLGIAAPTQAELEASFLNIAKFGTTAVDPVAAANNPALWQEKARELMSQGVVSFKVGEREVLNAYGLTKFPEGRGVVGDVTASAALSNTTTTTVNVLNQVYAGIYNGAPHISNVFDLKSGIQIAAGQQFSVDVGYVQAVDFAQQFAGPINGIANAAVAGVLMCELDVELSSPAQ